MCWCFRRRNRAATGEQSTNYNTDPRTASGNDETYYNMGQLSSSSDLRTPDQSSQQHAQQEIQEDGSAQAPEVDAPVGEAYHTVDVVPPAANSNYTSLDTSVYEAVN